MYTLDDICLLITDGSHFSPEDEGDGYPMLSVKDMGESDFDFRNCKHVGEESFIKLAANGCVPQVNDVVVAKDGSYLKTAFPIHEERNIALLSSIAILRPNTALVYPAYLSYFLKSEAVYRTVSLNYISGTALKRIILKGIKKIPIGLPDLEEQKRRAARLDKIYNIMKKRQQQLAALDDLIKARFVEMFGDAVINPHGYEQVTIGDACTLINGHAFKPSDWGEEGLPIVRIQNLNDANAPFNYYDGQVSEQHLIDSGMLLFSWSGTPGTSFGAFMWNRGPGALNQHIFKVIPKLDFDLDYLRYAMNGQLSTIIAKAHGGVGLQHITKAELEKILLLHPNMREQKQFASFVSQVNKSKVVVQKALDEAQVLFDSLMQQYFG